MTNINRVGYVILVVVFSVIFNTIFESFFAALALSVLSGIGILLLKEDAE